MRKVASIASVAATRASPRRPDGRFARQEGQREEARGEESRGQDEGFREEEVGREEERACEEGFREEAGGCGFRQRPSVAVGDRLRRITSTAPVGGAAAGGARSTVRAWAWGRR